MALEEGTPEAMAAILKVRDAERARKATKAALREAKQFDLTMKVKHHGSRFVTGDAMDFIPSDMKKPTDRD